VNRVVPLADLAAAAQALAHELVAAAPLALAAIKQVLRVTEAAAVADGYRVLRTGVLPAYRAMLTSVDAQEGPQAFAEKRQPVWRGV